MTNRVDQLDALNENDKFAVATFPTYQLANNIANMVSKGWANYAEKETGVSWFVVQLPTSRKYGLIFDLRDFAQGGLMDDMTETLISSGFAVIGRNVA
jgi:hypothetical protein